MEKLCGLFSGQRILSFFSIGFRVGLIYFLSALQPFELFPGPKLLGCQSRWRSPHPYGQTEMHQNSTDNVASRALVETLAEGSSLYDADGLDILTVIVEFSRFVKDQSGVNGCGKPITRGLKVPCQVSPLLTRG
jgi:hypothetical protein